MSFFAVFSHVMSFPHILCIPVDTCSLWKGTGAVYSWFSPIYFHLSWYIESCMDFSQLGRRDTWPSMQGTLSPSSLYSYFLCTHTDLFSEFSSPLRLELLWLFLISIMYLGSFHFFEKVLSKHLWSSWMGDKLPESVGMPKCMGIFSSLFVSRCLSLFTTLHMILYHIDRV